MKKIVCMVFLIIPFAVNSQNFKKTFFTILDEYIEKEPVKKGFDKDSVLLYVSVIKNGEIKNDFTIGISMYMFKYYPTIIDSLKTYNGVKMIVNYPKEKEKELFGYFKLIKDTREVNKKEKKFVIITNEDKSVENIIEMEDITPRYESVCNFVFQINNNNELYIISTSTLDDKYYYKKFKKKRLKFSKDLKLTKDLMQAPIDDDND